MSCLALCELSLSDQAAVQQSFAAAIAAKYGDLITLLDPPTAGASHPLGQSPAVGGSTLSLAAELPA